MNKNTLKAAIKNHSEAVLADPENAIAYLIEQSYSEDEAIEVVEAITSAQSEATEKVEKPEKVTKKKNSNENYEVWQLDLVTKERLKIKKTVNGNPRYVALLNEQKFNTNEEYVLIK